MPLTLAGLCRTTSVSPWPKPPTLGSIVKGWSASILSPCLTIISGPLGIFTLTASPLLLLIVNVVSLSVESILTIWPLTGEL